MRKGKTRGKEWQSVGKRYCGLGMSMGAVVDVCEVG